ncbi:unnamed protein product [Cyclocybe aegerita]|uniref:Uncharacterized protein n=1 Tax=Cyclocybe aegerita TaxID=1973307 RepID=A0A8S0WBK0_CYCAE|nr:unnamed protein product [Cyclocybe aegerita]
MRCSFLPHFTAVPVALLALVPLSIHSLAIIASLLTELVFVVVVLCVIHLIAVLLTVILPVVQTLCSTHPAHVSRLIDEQSLGRHGEQDGDKDRDNDDQHTPTVIFYRYTSTPALCLLAIQPQKPVSQVLATSKMMSRDVGRQTSDTPHTPACLYPSAAAAVPSSMAPDLPPLLRPPAHVPTHLVPSALHLPFCWCLWGRSDLQQDIHKTWGEFILTVPSFCKTSPSALLTTPIFSP